MKSLELHLDWAVFMVLVLGSLFAIMTEIPLWQTVGAFVLWSVTLVGIFAYLAVALAAAVANPEQRAAMWANAKRITFFGYMKMLVTYCTMIAVSYLVYPTNPALSGALMINTGLAMMFMVTYSDFARRSTQTVKE